MCPILTQAEGFVLGVGAKIFTIAGPVILYGTFAGFLYGIISLLPECFSEFRMPKKERYKSVHTVKPTVRRSIGATVGMLFFACFSMPPTDVSAAAKIPLCSSGESFFCLSRKTAAAHIPDR